MGERRTVPNVERRRAYGAHLAGCFGLSEPPSHVVQTIRRHVLAVSELRLDSPTPEPTLSVGIDDAFLAVVHLKNVNDHELWLNGRTVRAEPLRRGMTYIHELKQDPRAIVRQPAHAVHFYLPLSTLNAFAAQHNAPTISGLVYRPGAGRGDLLINPPFKGLGSAFGRQR